MMSNITAQELVLQNWKSQWLSVASTILCKAKVDNHVPDVVTEIEVETSHSTEVQKIEKSTSN